MTLSKNDLDNLFCSSNDNRRYNNTSELYELLKNNLIKVKCKFIKKVKPIKNNYCSNGGGEWHQDLCKYTSDIIIKKWRGTPKHEQYVNGKRVDIDDEKNNMVFEIGDTDSEYVMYHVLNNKYFVSVPFQNDEEYLQMFFYYCHNRKELQSYIDFKQEEILNEMLFAVNSLPSIKVTQ